jgi:hypothetical protein
VKAEIIPGKENVLTYWESRYYQDSSSRGLDPYMAHFHDPVFGFFSSYTVFAILFGFPTLSA